MKFSAAVIRWSLRRPVGGSTSGSCPHSTPTRVAKAVPSEGSCFTSPSQRSSYSLLWSNRSVESVIPCTITNTTVGGIQYHLVNEALQARISYTTDYLSSSGLASNYGVC